MGVRIDWENKIWYVNRNERKVVRIDNPNVPTSVSTNVKSADFKLYPNPAHDVLNIEFGNSSMAENRVSIYDIAGKKVYTTATRNASVQVNTANYTPGTYIVEISSVVAGRSVDTLYAASRIGNTMYKITGGDLYPISVDGNAPHSDISPTAPNPWSVMMAPDKSRYFVTCAQTNEVRVMDAGSDTLIKVISTGMMPQQMAYSEKKPYLFVTCMEDPASGQKSKGAVYVINYNTLEVMKRVEGGMYEPYGISVDDRAGKVYVMSRNLTSEGPAPHHGSPCDGRNGFYQIMDINTLSFPGTKRYEILANPTATTVRFGQ